MTINGQLLLRPRRYQISKIDTCHLHPKLISHFLKMLSLDDTKEFTAILRQFAAQYLVSSSSNAQFRDSELICSLEDFDPSDACLKFVAAIQDIQALGIRYCYYGSLYRVIIEHGGNRV
eukprot:TRINITY_DN32456_c0_g1_i1.p1 TRINITY_DN32456_c0_g1~~TRINITY_DN32456_c0_g1_i1.p1  ORF type:complete len:119 (+),score=10.53 TRINITY_DN32456_c0_g1_i1:101-457(+)